MNQEHIDRLYEVFSGYSPATLSQSCPCCVDRVPIADLQANPLRSLTVDDLQMYSWKAMTTIGTKYDYKYFLPRICEIIATEKYPYNIEVVLAGKLLMAEFSGWPDMEKAAVRGFLLEFWRDLLCNWPYHEIADAILCCVASTKATGEALDMWSQLLETERTARLRFADWLSWGRGWEKIPVFWEQVAEEWDVVEEWIFSPNTRCFAERAFAEYSETPDGLQMGYKLQQYLAAIR